MTSDKKIINSFKKVCICRSIKGGTILTAIGGGALSFEALRRKIRVGTGNCKAKRCREKVEAMVREYKENQKVSTETHASN
ncbi:MAG: (2Fe-2S)-binding protein [Nitrospinaceae bacterium]|nr:(2Fe-2S)-binding protein [Nitrospinaceae bacterium]MDP7557325.1 (2Fe-2S)-binding protein [Nitrospinaceae bacterium]